MFCRYKGESLDRSIVSETVYWLEFTNDISKKGGIHAKIPANYVDTIAWHKKYESFEEFIAEWEIV